MTYTYRVIPVHAELLNNGILLEGVQAVQIARSRHSAGGSSSAPPMALERVAPERSASEQSTAR